MTWVLIATINHLTTVMHELQKRMAFFLDNEDVVSAAMTVTHSLLDNYNVDPRSIGRYVHLCSLSDSAANWPISDSNAC